MTADLWVASLPQAESVAPNPQSISPESTNWVCRHPLGSTSCTAVLSRCAGMRRWG